MNYSAAAPRHAGYKARRARILARARVRDESTRRERRGFIDDR